jgi:hypothetical protein
MPVRNAGAVLVQARRSAASGQRDHQPPRPPLSRSFTVKAMAAAKGPFEGGGAGGGGHSPTGRSLILGIL